MKTMNMNLRMLDLLFAMVIGFMSVHIFTRGLAMINVEITQSAVYQVISLITMIVIAYKTYTHIENNDI